MKCNQAQKNISQYYDGQLKKEDWRKLKGHLAGCSGCLQTFQKMAKLSDKVKKLNVPFKPVAFSDTIIKRKPFTKPVVVVSIVFALIALVIGVNLFMPLSPASLPYRSKLASSKKLADLRIDSGYGAAELRRDPAYLGNEWPLGGQTKKHKIDTRQTFENYKKTDSQNNKLQIVQDITLTVKIQNMTAAFKKLSVL